jgi:tetratricopeptide (TPR) repeat protein
LTPEDSLRAEALLWLARGEFDRACPAWREFTRREPGEFFAWYTSAVCQMADRAVVRDRLSPSGWRFRSSHHSAIEDYRRAFDLRPSAMLSFRSGAYRPLRDLLATDEARLRAGVALAPDTGQFVAWPGWQADTLAFTPWPLSYLARIGSAEFHASLLVAVRQQRRIMREIASSWVAAQPDRAEAREALAVALMLQGDRAAIDTLRTANRLASDPETRLTIAASQVWMQTQFGVPRRIADVRAARHLADSILAAEPVGHTMVPGLVARLAALTGRFIRAAAYLRAAGTGEEWNPPSPLLEAAPAMLLYASAGGPRDSLLNLERLTTLRIETNIPQPDRLALRLSWLGRAATIAFPDVEMVALTGLRDSSDWVLDMQSSLVRGDTAAARRGVKERRLGTGTTRGWDAVYANMALLVGVGADTVAAAYADRNLDALFEDGPLTLADPTTPGALVRVMALRADLARKLDDPETARRWAEAVVVLWSDGDDFLQPVIGHMRAITELGAGPSR